MNKMLRKPSEEIKRNKILVIGDVMLDVYLFGTILRISPEAPVPIFNKVAEKYTLGGAANVASNLVAAGQVVTMATTLGQDENGKILKELLKENGIDSSFVYIDKDRPTITKTRLLGQNNQQVMRIDEEEIKDVGKDIQDKILLAVKSNINQFDVVVISDYLKGLLTEYVIQSVISIANESNVKVLIDVKDVNYMKYKGAYLLKPNIKELNMLMGEKTHGLDEIIDISWNLCKECEVEYVLTTCGEKGMVLVDKMENHYEIKGTVQEVYDVTGAGDTVIAYLAAAIASNVPMKRAIEISNIAAGIQVSKVGTSKITIQEVDGVGKLGLKWTQKVITKESLMQVLKQSNKKIVFTNGCFDILHVGHLRYLKSASDLGDILVIGLNSDDSVARLKGKNRPINSFDARAEMLANLDYVDYIIKFNEDTPVELIRYIEPNILVKGEDYLEKEIVGSDIVESKGGSVVLLPYYEGNSTTQIIKRLAVELEKRD